MREYNGKINVTKDTMLFVVNSVFENNIKESTTKSDVDYYGYLFWRGKYNSYRADGKYSQISMILPEKNSVITVVSECRRGDELMSVLYDMAAEL